MTRWNLRFKDKVLHIEVRIRRNNVHLRPTIAAFPRTDPRPVLGEGR